MNCRCTMDMHTHWSLILMNTEKPEIQIWEGCELVGDSLLCSLEGIYLKMQWLQSFGQVLCKSFIAGTLFSEQLKYKLQFSHSSAQTERPLCSFFTRTEFHYCSIPLHWWFHGRGRDLKNVKQYCKLMQRSDTYFSSCCYLFIIVVAASVRKIMHLSLNLSRWWATKLSETFIVFLYVPSTLREIFILMVAWLSI